MQVLDCYTPMEDGSALGLANLPIKHASNQHSDTLCFP
jgi:hypothetical protein